MSIKKVTPEEKAIREAEDKKRFSDFIEEGMTPQQAAAAVQALKQQNNGEN